MSNDIKVSERRQVHIINPASGSGRFFEEACRAAEASGGEVRKSERPGMIEEIARDVFFADPYAYAIVYGGDGTVTEAVNGIMKSGHADTAIFSVVPTGSGNDFSAFANHKAGFPSGEATKIDVVKTFSEKLGERYYVNVMNVGFDCAVVVETYKLKANPLFHGKMAYIGGVVKTLGNKKPIAAKITLTRPDGREEVIEKEVLLAACANSQFYGGGFCAAPLADLTDGEMDVVIVDDISIPKFVSMVGAYRAGSYISKVGVLEKKYGKILSYTRCVKMKFEGPQWVCFDGEVMELGEDRTLTAEVLRGALSYVPYIRTV